MQGDLSMPNRQEKMEKPKLQPQAPTLSEGVYVGIDVSKDKLDVCLNPTGLILCVNNTKAGISKLLRELNDFEVELVVLEATGKYHRLAHELLHDAGLKVAVVNPYRSRQFADSMGNSQRQI
jgi:transposase